MYGAQICVFFLNSKDLGYVLGCHNWLVINLWLPVLWASTSIPLTVCFVRYTHQTQTIKHKREMLETCFCTICDFARKTKMQQKNKMCDGLFFIEIDIMCLINY